MLKKLLNRVLRRYAYRSAITGRFVTREYAKMFPENVVRERIN